MTSDFAQEELPPIFPVCLVIDVSGSMAGAPIKAVNNRLPAVINNNAFTGALALCVGIVDYLIMEQPAK